jgi:RNA ligase (TIGR02306 family)
MKTLSNGVEELKSTHKTEVVKVELHAHNQADNLSIVNVWGYTVCVNTEAWKGVSLGVFLPPDSLVDVRRPEFAFLAAEARYNADSTPGGTYARIKGKKLRGVFSYGLLVPVPEGVNAVEGDDLAETLEVAHYEPLPVDQKGKRAGGNAGEAEAGPSYPKYDVDSFQRYAAVAFTDGESVVVTEKIHGENARYVYDSKAGRMYCGSRNLWKAEYTSPPKITLQDFIDKIGNEDKAREVYDRVVTNFKPQRNKWWAALDHHPEIVEFCKANPDVVVYGELYGGQGGYDYGVPQGEHRVAVFDLLANGKWVDVIEARCHLGQNLPWVPIVTKGSFVKYNFDMLVKLASGPSLIAGAKNIREGVVVSPLTERYHPKVGRVKLKIVSPEYLMGK